MPVSGVGDIWNLGWVSVIAIIGRTDQFEYHAMSYRSGLWLDLRGV